MYKIGRNYSPTHLHLKRMGAFLFFILIKNMYFPVGVRVSVSLAAREKHFLLWGQWKNSPLTDFVPGPCQAVQNICGFIQGWKQLGCQSLLTLSFEPSERRTVRAATGADPSLLPPVHIKSAFSPVLKAGIQKYWCTHGCVYLKVVYTASQFGKPVEI